MALTYADSGVNRVARAEAKKFDSLELPNGSVKTPYNLLLPLSGEKYYLLSADGVGTKVLLAQLAGKYDSIGIDGVAMVVNDAVRCGATPLSLVDIIDVAKTEKSLLSQLLEGIAKGAQESGCKVVGGETADVASMVKGVSDNPFQMNFVCYSEVPKEKVIDGTKITPGDKVIGLRSSGLHSNGISLARKALFKEWGGRFNAFDKADGFDKELVLEALTPTRIYVKQVLEAAKQFNVKAVVNITGDAYAKFSNLFNYSNAGFSFDNFSPQRIFSLVQQEGGVSTEEMFKTFNMGWGMAIVVGKEEAEDAVEFFSKSFEAGIIGEAIPEKKVEINHGGKTFTVA